jgi:hypothetical protein
VPHGKQDWYVNTGGIWQDVTLTPRAATWIDRLHITPDVRRSAARVELGFGGELDRLAGTTARLEVREDGMTVATSEVDLTPEPGPFETLIDLPDFQAWTPETPVLYELVASIDVDGRRTRRSSRFGMRSFEAVDGRFELNGRPLYLRAVLDQDFYPETVSTVPSVDDLRDQFAKVKQLGFNCLRCHIKPPDPLYLDLADEVGLLVWEELPSWRTYWAKGSLDPAQIRQSDEERRRVERTLDAVIERDFNHPSLVIRTLVNEDWGTALPFSEPDRRWLVGLYDRCKQLDPTRLVIDNSACAAPWGTSFHLKSDIDDFHLYATIPDQAQSFADAVADLALRPSWTYSPHGDAQRRGDEPIVLSEFGNWGLPTLAALSGTDTDREPAWFDVRPWGGGWDQEPGAPAGAEERFRELGLAAVWDGFDAFASATQRHQGAALRFEVETIRRHSSIAGYVTTELTDTYWESNGILDFQRGSKAVTEDLATFNAEDVLLATPDHRSYRSGGVALLDVEPSLVGPGLQAGSRIGIRIGDGPTVASAPATGDGVKTPCIEPIRIQLPAVAALSYIPISIDIVEPEREARLRTVVSVAVLPERDSPALARPLSVVRGAGDDRTDGASLAARLEAAGYRVVERLVSGSTLAVASTVDADLLDWVDAGGRLLFLGERRSPFFWVQGRGGAAEGWITSYSWIRAGVHGRLQGAANPLGLEFADVMPERTIVGLPFQDSAIHDDVLAGMIVGWAHHPAAHTLRFRFGRGIVVMTMFKLGRNVGLDPVASAMFDDLMEHVASERCQPNLVAQRGTRPPRLDGDVALTRASPVNREEGRNGRLE